MSTLLLPLSVAAYVAVNVAAVWLAGLLILPSGNARGVGLLTLTADVIFIAAWYWLLLRLFRRDERYHQTAAAILGCTALLTPPLALAAQLVEASASGRIAWLAAPALLVFVAMVVWSVLVSAHILRHALERPLPICVILVVVQLISEQLLVSILP